MCDPAWSSRHFKHALSPSMWLLASLEALIFNQPPLSDAYIVHLPLKTQSSFSLLRTQAVKMLSTDYGEERRRQDVAELRLILVVQQTIDYQNSCLRQLLHRGAGHTNTELEFLSRFELQAGIREARLMYCGEGITTEEDSMACAGQIDIVDCATAEFAKEDLPKLEELVKNTLYGHRKNHQVQAI
ncbi:hypothetical protein IF2G_10722 [Cordyceps javanica]|nr:hypothetical protein IF2G_10722 [Cordyceps javanica]